jgi:AraC-like DNA-binding protein
MRVELRENGVLVSGFLDTSSASHGDAFDTVLVRGTHPYEDEVRPHCLGALNACDITGSHQVGVLPAVSPASRDDRHSLGLLLTGHGTLERGGHLTPLTPGDFVIYSGRRHPFRLQLNGPFRYFVIDLNQADSSFLRKAGPAIANPELPRLASGRILTATLAEIAGLAAQMGPLTRQEMGEHITCMLRTVIHEATRCGPDAHDARAAILDQVLNYIDQHLSSELTPDSIAAAQHVSVRYLHALFQRQDDTVGHCIRRRRLDRIRRDLTDPDLAHLPAHAVAARWGLPNRSHFGKLFRNEFGLSPHEFRQQVRITACPPGPARHGHEQAEADLGLAGRRRLGGCG